MSEEDGGFLRRWSERKRRVDEEQPAHDTPAPAEDAAQTQSEAEAEERRRLIDSLPDIDTMTEESDFSAFMQGQVPDELRNRALRKLWRLNPVYACVDGLNDYDLDYTDATRVVENLKTAYRVGKGFTRDAETLAEGEEAAAAPETAETPEEEREAEPEAEAPRLSEPETAEPVIPPPDTQEKAPADPRETASAKRPGAARRRWGLDPVEEE